MPPPCSILNKPRLEMDLRSAGLSLAQYLGRYRNSRARPALAEHSHGDAFEICYLVKGRQTYRVQGRDYHLRGGDVFIAFPQEQHSTGGAPQEKGTLYWLVVQAPEKISRPRRPSGPPGNALEQALRHLPDRQFRGSGKMKEHLDALAVAFHGRGPLRELTMEYLVTGFLLEVVHCAANPPAVMRRSLDTVLRYIAGHLDEPLSVPRLAKLARLSAPHFKARFKEETGVPPAEYQLRARIEESRRRLVAGKQTVTEIAFDLGFSSSQYFATVFKRYTGENPGSQARKKHPAQKQSAGLEGQSNS